MAENEAPTIEAEATAPANGPLDGAAKRSASRDIPVATIVRLLGIPTQADFSVLDTKLDMLTSKLNALAIKVDRLLSQLGAISNEFYVDRIDFQLGDIRNMMKKVFPQAITTNDVAARDTTPRRVERAPEKSHSEDSAAGAANAETKGEPV